MTITETTRIAMTAGRDYSFSDRYEYVITGSDDPTGEGVEILARAGGFKSNAQAKRAGLKAAQAFLA